MQNNITELVFILDRSGSMAGLESDTIGGFNAMIEQQKTQDAPCYVSTILFNHESKVIHDREKLAEIHPMTESDYTVYGCTALIDALGGAIHHIEKIHKYFGDSAPSKTLFVITTDGMENASKNYNAKAVKRMIEDKKEKFGWEFIFIGANIDAVETASHYGINSDCAVNYNADSRGTNIVYEALGKAVRSVRCGEKLKSDWNAEINADYRQRGKK